MTRHAFEAACSVPWAINEAALRTILEISNRENTLTPEAIQDATGEHLNNTHKVVVRDGVAIIPVCGPLFRYANLFSMISGATSIEMIAQDVRSALDNPNVKALVLEIDSPGGEVNGTSELADIIYNARGTKPIVAFIGNEGASGAYWIGSAAEKVVAVDTAIVGSIGVVAVLRKRSSEEKASEVELVSSNAPNKRVDIGTDKGKAVIQKVLDDTETVFVSTVARNRGVSVETVLENFGQGGVFVGQSALEAGLVDEIGTLNSVLQSLGVSNSGNNNNSGNNTSGSKLADILDGENGDDDLDAKYSNRWGARMSFKDRWNKLKSMMDEPLEDDEMPDNQDSAVVVNTPVNTGATSGSASSTIGITQPTSTSIAAPTFTTGERLSDAAELAALRAENTRLRMERYTAEANAFISEHIHAGRAFPGEREAAMSVFIQASNDDATLGASANGSMSRVDMLRALYAARPEKQVNIESITPSILRIMQQQDAPPPGAKTEGEKELSQPEVDKLLSMTSMGATHLREVKNGSH